MSVERAWGAGWIGPFEGPFTLAWKYAWANMASSNEIARLFRRRSLSRYGCGSEALALLAPPRPGKSLEEQQVAWPEHFLSAYAGEQIAKLLADSTAFRYCRSCLTHGYQSTFLQITALSRCPIHRDFLLAKCLTCGASTPSYALDWSSFRTPFYCSFCCSPFSETISINAWSETRDFHAACEVAFRPIAKWLQALKVSLPNSIGSAAPILSEDDIHLKVLDVKQQVAQFWILSQVESIDVDRDLFVPLDSRVRFILHRDPTPISAFPVDSPKTHDEFALIYKSIRRQITKRFFSKRRGWIRDLSSRPILYAFGKPVQVEEPGSAQALAIWRSYYEDSIDELQYRRRLLELGRSNYLLKYSEIDRNRSKKRFSYFSIVFCDSLSMWRDSELSTLAQLVLAHFYAICSAISAFFEEEAKLEHPVLAPATPTEVLAKAQHRFNREVVALSTYWLQGAKEDTDISRAEGFSLEAGHKFARLHQRRLLRFNSRCADMLLERDLSCIKPGAFP